MEVQLAYAIGVAEPVSVMADTFGTGTIPNSQITELIRANFKLTPKGIIETLDLRRPIYRPTAAYGHFGRTGPGFTWERTDKADAIRKEAALRKRRRSSLATMRNLSPIAAGSAEFVAPVAVLASRSIETGSLCFRISTFNSKGDSPWKQSQN